MRKILLITSLLFVPVSLWGASPSLAACNVAIAVTGGSSFPSGSKIVLTATVTGTTCQPVSQVAFYNGSTLLGVAANSPYTITWDTTGVPTNIYNNIYAAASFVGSTAGATATTIDMVGSTTLGPNPALDPSFGYGGAGNWLQGDSQLCKTTWPYSGSSYGDMSDSSCPWDDTGGNPTSPTITANSTIDNLDATLHALSDFDVFAVTLLKSDVGTLSSTFQSWYPQAQAFIDPATGELPPAVSHLNTWEPLITNWLNINYANAGAWCLPPATTGSANEDAYINANDNAGPWGGLASVVACENYNATVPVANYQACMTLLQTSCPASATGACDPATLGRSLAGPAPAFDGCTGNYAQWVQNSLTAAGNETPKFVLRGQFLSDIYTRALTMQAIFGQGAAALQSFLGSAAQLAGAQSQSAVTQSIPNSVIYGWQDNLPVGGAGGCTDTNGTRIGCSHVVKVTAYSTARCGNYCGSTADVATINGISPKLPWIKTHSGFLTRTYALMDRDAYVYVSVKRWDQDHSNTTLFPNGRPLWQFKFQNPKTITFSGTGLLGQCKGLQLSNGSFIGFGITNQMLAALGDPTILPTGITPQDVTALSNAFMLNDNIGGSVDPNSGSASYAVCLSTANTLLGNAPESHACAEYVASGPSQSVVNGSSQDGDQDYSIKFVDCSTQLPGGIPSDDLGFQQQGG